VALRAGGVPCWVVPLVGLAMPSGRRPTWHRPWMCLCTRR